uniref:ADP-ribosylation factor n=1 Tax=Chromera velia CCMP2878 TaxID=1169474 RepID=A0A0G4HB31_9ALVE|eukprot:Cvel_25886.t1-p1 / transcript=Cvel_25886.t1 / gene=Cvel_25886 / organism=Chromera_velia_CCMP2878 / gene_product=ADP-ribosylation factor 4, putative / transcript_product=ADP-ribosylation factor 4, putative / location=Cvel_scaffold2990:3459-5241(+) / protein_length=316 / sequence_SO=supercontig / SO=protein_coding / is_pseudo=false
MPKKSFLDNLKGVLGLGGAKQSRGLFLGLDASGRTTLLYRLVLGECVPTIPTIGFNVETVTHRNTNFTLWDVGGCDKIRPLWRHYFQGTCVMFFFVDSADRERLQDAFKEITKYVLCEDALKGVPLVLVMTKQASLRMRTEIRDLPGCMPPSEILDKLQVEKNLRGRWWKHVAVATPEGIGIEEVKEAMWEANEAFLAGSCSSSSAAPPSGSAEGEKEKEEAEKRREETKAGDRNLKGQNIAEVLEDWLSREDEEAEVFLAHLENFTLESWDHYTHLRIAWLLINTHGQSGSATSSCISCLYVSLCSVFFNRMFLL